ncbi:MAG: RNase adapter RapZ [Nitrospiria bacterium]
MKKKIRLVIVSGLSGSGKSSVIKYLEDLDFFCIDNLPPQFLLKFVELCRQSGESIVKAAVGVDIRERDFLSNFLNVFDELRETGYHAELLFLEARDEVLLRRFSETRRPHPLAKEGSVIDGIKLEREKLDGLRRRADRILDTSDYYGRQLEGVLTQTYVGDQTDHRMRLSLVSFGFKFGVPTDLDLLFDVRFLSNPYFQASLKPLTGESSHVQKYLLELPEANMFLERLYGLLDFLLPLYKKEGKSYLTIGLGCTGGRHRSVAMVEFLRTHLQETGFKVHHHHRDVGQSQ